MATTPPKIQIRRAQPGDALGIAQCWHRAFSGSDLNDWLLPPTYPHHDSYITQFARTQRFAILQGDATIIVASVPGIPVAGYATYKEMQDNKVVAAGGDTSTDIAGVPTYSGRSKTLAVSVTQRIRYAYQWLLYALHDVWDKYVLKRPGLDFSDVDNRFTLIAKAQKAVLERNPGHPGNMTRYLYITWLAVHPDAQGLGVAKRLLEYGETSGLPLYLEASHRGHPVYLKRGFVDLVPELEILREDGSLVETLPTMLYHPKETIR